MDMKVDIKQNVFRPVLLRPVKNIGAHISQHTLTHHEGHTNTPNKRSITVHVLIFCHVYSNQETLISILSLLNLAA